MGRWAGAILANYAHFCRRRQPKWVLKQASAKFGVFGEKCGILGVLSHSFDHFMAIFGDFREFGYWPISLF